MSRVMLQSITLLIFLMGLFPLPAKAGRDRKTMDEALLLMVASHLGVDEDLTSSGSATTSKRARTNLIGIQPGEILAGNEIEYLRDLFKEACLLGTEMAKTHFTGQDECEQVAMMETECAKLNMWLDEQAEELARARRRRARNRGLQGVFRSVGRAIRNANPRQAFRWLGKEVLPEVAKAALTGGVAWEGQALRHLGRQVLAKKIKNEIGYAIVRNRVRGQAQVSQRGSSLGLLMRGAEHWQLNEGDLARIKEICEEENLAAETEPEGETPDDSQFACGWDHLVQGDTLTLQTTLTSASDDNLDPHLRGVVERDGLIDLLDELGCGLNHQAYVDRVDLDLAIDMDTGAVRANVNGHARRDWADGTWAEGEFNSTGISAEITAGGGCYYEFEGTGQVQVSAEGFLSCGNASGSDRASLPVIVRGNLADDNWHILVGTGKLDIWQVSFSCLDCPYP